MPGVPDDADAARAPRVAVLGRLGIHPRVKLTLPARRLIAYLALHDAPVSRAHAAAAMWPDVPEQHGRSNLRRSLWQVPDGWIAADADEVELCARVDYLEARGVADDAVGGAPLSLGDVRMLSEDLLPGWHEEWVTPAQDAFRLLRVQALEAGCRTMSRAHEHAIAAQAGLAALAAEPLCESAASALLDAYLRQGNRYAAIRLYREFCATLREELGVAPDTALSARMTRAGIRTTGSPA